MAVKLDVLVNYIINNSKLKAEMAKFTKNMAKTMDSTLHNIPLTKQINAENEAAKKRSAIYENILSTLEKANRQRKLAYMLEHNLYGLSPEGKRTKTLTPAQLARVAEAKTNEQIANLGKYETAKSKALEQALYGTSEDYEEKKREAKRSEKEISKDIDRTLKEYDNLSKNTQETAEKNFGLRMKHFLEQSKEYFDIDLKKKKEKDYYMKWASASEEEQDALDEDIKWLKEGNKTSKDTNKLLKNILKGKWGAFLGSTIAGAALYGAYRLIRKGAGYAYTTSQEALDWQRTISGGASGGDWFGQGLAAYQRAGIGAGQYQGFKRGLQSYLGQVKLGMGNAAPLMYLGLNALDNPDMLEKQLSKALRRLPKDVSVALAGQMGLDYAMWEAIYSGRLDREKSYYSEEAIRKWSEVADNINDMITKIKVFFFNNLADPIARFVEIISKAQQSYSDKVGWAGSMSALTLPQPLQNAYLAAKGIQVYVDVKGKLTPSDIASETAKSIESNEGIRVMCENTAQTYPDNR